MLLQAARYPSAPRTIAPLLVLLVTALAPAAALAVCDVIPGASQEFRAAVGATNRPFVSPDEFVAVRVRTQVCDTESLGLATTAAGNVVTLLFTPPLATAAPTAVVLTDDCAALGAGVCNGGTSPGVSCLSSTDCEGGGTCLGGNPNPTTSPLAACQAALPNGGRARCRAVNPAIDFELVSSSVDRALTFRFPDTDALVAPAGDRLGLAGPAKIVVTPKGTPLACGVATQRCAALAPQTVAACVDELYAQEAGCSTAVADRDGLFGDFTALPRPNDYRAICENQPGAPCANDANRAVQFTTDRDGNLLLPMEWQGVQAQLDGVPIPRLVRTATQFEAFDVQPGAGNDPPVRLPSEAFVNSFSPKGFPVAPIFAPLSDGTDADEMKLFGSVDAPFGIVRVARRNPESGECLDSAGAPAGLPCQADADCAGGQTCGVARCRQGGLATDEECTSDASCVSDVGPGSTCGPALFDFSDRFSAGGRGPVVVPPDQYTAEARELVPLEGLIETDEFFAFGRVEAFESVDLNGDTDISDFLLTLGGKEDGLGQSLEAGTRLRVGRFRYPALATRGDLLAFLEPEQARFSNENITPVNSGVFPQDACDYTADGDCSDTVVRLYRQPETGSPVNLTPAPLLCADAETAIAGQSLAFQTDERLLFRSAEASCADRTTPAVTLTPGGVLDTVGGTPEDVSADGDVVAFLSGSAALVPGPIFGDGSNAFARRLSTGTTSLASVNVFGNAAGSSEVRLSADGRFVFFTSGGTGIIPEFIGFEFLTPLVYVRDLALGTTELVTRYTFGAPSGGARTDISATLVGVSDDGRFVSFTSTATGLDPAASTVGFLRHLYVLDRATGTTRIVDAPPPGNGSVEANGNVVDADMSPNGRYFAFRSNAGNLTSADGNGDVFDVFFRDLDTPVVELAAVTSSGVQADNDSREPSVSADGRYVAFESYATNLLPGGGGFDYRVYVRDRVAKVTEAVPLPRPLFENDLTVPTIARDGRYLAFNEGCCEGSTQVYELDRLTGILEFVNYRSEFRTLGIVPERTSPAPARVGRGGRDFLLATSEEQLQDPATVGGAFENAFLRTAAFEATADYSGDGDVRDVVLRGVNPATGVVTDYCPAGKVEIAPGGAAAFLRPEAAGPTGGGSVCPASTSGLPNDVNEDGDVLDSVVHLLGTGGGITNLERAATDVAISDEIVAALVSEAGQGATPQNGDGDALDDVLFLQPTAGASPAGWLSTGQAGRTLAASGPFAVTKTCEAAQAGADATNDGDAADCTLQIADGRAGVSLLSPTDTQGRRQPAEDFVAGNFAGRCVQTGTTTCTTSADCDADQFCGTQGACIAVQTEPASCATDNDCTGGGTCEADLLVAYRTREFDFCNPATSQLTCSTFFSDEGLVEVGQLTGSCSVATCDQNGDGDCCDDAMQAYDLLQGRTVGSGSAASPCDLQACDPRKPYRVLAEAGKVRFLVREIKQGEDLNDDGDRSDLLVQLWDPRTGEIQVEGQVVEPDPDQPEPPTSSGDPLGGGERPGAGSGAGPGSSVFPSSGVCKESFGLPTGGGCPENTFLAANGLCLRRHGVCRTDADCPATAFCDRGEGIQVAVADQDADGVSDPIDNCIRVRNPDQRDADVDGVGDRCDVAICGNGTLEATAGETCDDGNLIDFDGCSRTCQADGILCDANADLWVDSVDVNAIFAARNTPATGPSDVRDADHDGQITVLDSRACTLRCNLPGCGPRPEETSCGLLGIEALLALVPFALRRARRIPSGVGRRARRA